MEPLDTPKDGTLRQSEGQGAPEQSECLTPAQILDAHDLPSGLGRDEADAIGIAFLGNNFPSLKDRGIEEDIRIKMYLSWGKLDYRNAEFNSDLKKIVKKLIRRHPSAEYFDRYPLPIGFDPQSAEAFAKKFLKENFPHLERQGLNDEIVGRMYKAWGDLDSRDKDFAKDLKNIVSAIIGNLKVTAYRDEQRTGSVDPQTVLGNFAGSERQPIVHLLDSERNRILHQFLRECLERLDPKGQVTLRLHFGGISPETMAVIGVFSAEILSKTESLRSDTSQAGASGPTARAGTSGEEALDSSQSQVLQEHLNKLKGHGESVAFVARPFVEGCTDHKPEELALLGTYVKDPNKAKILAPIEGWSKDNDDWKNERNLIYGAIHRGKTKVKNCLQSRAQP